jgi:diguanylate cyclase (GGDEF)-like protein
MDQSENLPADLPALDVLIVEDEAATARLLSSWLSHAGYRVCVATCAEEAITIIEQQFPRFVLTDWELPDLSGLELCLRIRQMALPHYVYIVFCTVHRDSEHIVSAYEAGADDFLSKPLVRSELLARLKAGGRVIELERRLTDLARTDPLTGIPTQRSFHERFAAEWARGTRHHTLLSCVMFDIDYFKRINDTLGHPVGDEVIKSVANLLAQSCRQSDVFCRYGGEEFCVLLPETTEAQAMIWADRLRQRISEQILLTPDAKSIKFTTSFGVSERTEDLDGPSTLVDQADQALLVAKQSGRNRTVAYSTVHAASELSLAGSNGYAAVFGGVRARDVMTSVLACLHCDRTLGEAAEFFLEHRINSAPVVNHEGKLVGMLSERDLMGVMLAPDSWGVPIREIMKANVVSYEEDTPILSIFDFLCRVTIRRVVIVSGGVPTGVVSRGSLLQWFRNWVRTVRLEDGSGRTSPLAQALANEDEDDLTLATSTLVKEAMNLHERLSGNPIDFMPALVGGTSRMQDLIADLLVRARQFERPRAPFMESDTELANQNS